jgi:putative transposase
MQITVKLRLRDKHAVDLNPQARAVNFVWNYCNEGQRHAFDTRWAWKDKWLSYKALASLTAGTAEDLDLHSHTIQRVCREYIKSHNQHKKRCLRFRGRKSLGWVPFNTGHVSFDGEAFTFRGVRYTAMHMRDVLKPAIKIGAGSFNQDARGRWYINLPIEVECANRAPNTRVGIDLGLKAFAILSDEREIEIPQFYRKSEEKVATIQRAKKTPKRIRAIHTKIANRRKDFLHKESTKIVKEYGLIVVGNASSSKLAKTNMAKSVFDAGWSAFRNMLAYKAITRGGMCLKVNEAYTSQTCAECRSIAGPKGRAGLNKRMWTCSDCGVVHHRDLNAARNILRVGLHTLVEGARARKQVPSSLCLQGRGVVTHTVRSQVSDCDLPVNSKH